MTTPTHCCERLRAQVEHSCDEHPRDGACPDQLVGFSARFDEYGLWVHSGDAGEAVSWLGIDFCPFCGTRLPASRREEWFDRIEAAGLDPENAPEELHQYGWWLQAP